MLRRLLRDLALVMIGAIAGLMLLEQLNPHPPALLVASGMVGMKPPAVPAAAQAYPDNARPVLQHCYPVVPSSPRPSVVVGPQQQPVT